MEVIPLTGHIGAEVTQVQAAGIDDKHFEQLKQALWTHQVLVLRAHNMTIEDQVALGQRFGELHTHPAFPGSTGTPPCCRLPIAVKIKPLRKSGIPT